MIKALSDWALRGTGLASPFLLMLLHDGGRVLLTRLLYLSICGHLLVLAALMMVIYTGNSLLADVNL